MKIKSLPTHIIRHIEEFPVTFWQLAAAFVGLIVLRLSVEYWLMDFKSANLSVVFYEFTHNLLFFLLAFLFSLFFLSNFLKVSFSKTANLLIWGFLVILLPPIIDYLVSRGKGLWSFYIFDSLSGLWIRFWTFFGDSPHIGITYGVRVEVALVIALLFLYALVKTNNFSKSVATAGFAYLTLFLLGTFPSWLTFGFLAGRKSLLEIGDVDVAMVFLTPAQVFSFGTESAFSSLSFKMSLVYGVLLAVAVALFLWMRFRKIFGQVLKDIRPLRLVYHWGLLFVGMGIGVFYTGMFALTPFNLLALANILIAIGCAWIASLFANDYYDREADKVSNKERFSVRRTFTDSTFVTLGIIFFFSSLLFSAMVSIKLTFFLFVYQLLAWFYSASPFRLKRFPLVASFVSALASVLVLIVGFTLVTPSNSFEMLPSRVLWLLIIGYTLAIPIKDLKDIKGDKKTGVLTLPVILGEERARLVIAVGVFISHLLSVVLINESRLFWPAVIFGAAAFWLINWKKITPSRILFWVFAEVFAYGLVLTRIIFFP